MPDIDDIPYEDRIDEEPWVAYTPSPPDSPGASIMRALGEANYGMNHPVFDPNSPHYVPVLIDEDGNELVEATNIARIAAQQRYDDTHEPNGPHRESTNYTNYQDAPLTCIECGMRCTRPTPKTIRTKTCKQCRYSLRDNEAANTFPSEIGVQTMPDKKETIIINPSPIKKGILQKMRIQRTAEGIQLIYESPIMQNYFKSTWFRKAYAPENDGQKIWVSNIFPETTPQRTYFSIKDLPTAYHRLFYFSYGDQKLVSNGKPNLGFLQAVNDYPLDDKGQPMKKTPATEALKRDRELEFMNPKKPIVISIKGMFPNSVLDDYLMRTKEVMYQIYSENLMPFDKSMIISMESQDANQA